MCSSIPCTSLDSVGLVRVISPFPLAGLRVGGFGRPIVTLVTVVLGGLGVVRDVSIVVVSLRV